ncbi:hypothetical protein SASPL_143796 [Salvia splendens]|uniref:RRM domain-containing protein n=1 Tax=Salvia splendens TaxID=180675 RepID=A0A8X8WMU9_SALSN|nr:hypothetical protein SASPL_143796 [Salvia splendens]
MGRRYVEGFRCKKQDCYHAIASEVKEGSYGSVDHRGSPPPARRKRSPEKERMDVKEEKIHIACRSDGKATGEAYVELGSVEEARKAMSKDKMMIGSRYVELFPSTPEELKRAASRSR